MKSKTNPATIGAFVAGALALAVVAIVVLGKGAFLEQKYHAVVCFDESITGLDVGAPVDFMGVQIGSVVSIDLVVDVAGLGFRRPVTIALEGRRVTFTGIEDDEEDDRVDDWVERLIQERGLRAQLATQSMLTGKLKIQMVMHPNAPVRRMNVPGPLLEIPTIPSTQATIVKSIEHIPLEAIMADIREIAAGVKMLVNDPQTRELVKNLNVTLKRLDGTMAELETFLQDTGLLLGELNQDARPLLQKAADSADTLQVFLANIETQTAPMLESMTALNEHLSGTLDDQSPLHTALLGTLDELRRTLQSVGNLADYLNRYPEALIQGKK